MVPLVKATIKNGDGDATLSTIAAGPMVDLDLGRAGSALRGAVGVATLVAHTTTFGSAKAPLVGHHSDQTRFVPTLTMGATYSFTSLLAFRDRAGFGVALPDIDVRFAGTTVAHWGVPYAFGSGGPKYYSER